MCGTKQVSCSGPTNIRYHRWGDIALGVCAPLVSCVCGLWLVPLGPRLLAWWNCGFEYLWGHRYLSLVLCGVRGLPVRLITRPEEFCRVWWWSLDNERGRGPLGAALKKIYIYISSVRIYYLMMVSFSVETRIMSMIYPLGCGWKVRGSNLGRDVSLPYRPTLGFLPTLLSSGHLELFPRRWSSRSVMLTIHLHSLPRLRHSFVIRCMFHRLNWLTGFA